MKHKMKTQTNKTLEIEYFCQKCGVREATHLHHTIFDTTTNKSDKTSPTINICAICHAEIHGISPQISELRMLVTEYNRVQKTRIIYDNTMRGFSHIEMKVPIFFQEQSKELNRYEKLLSKKIKLFLEGKDHMVTENHINGVFPIYSWLKSIKGVGHLLSAQLISYIDIKKFRQVSSLWHYSGMHVNNGIAPRRSKGNKIDWNPQMRMICYKISDSFIKQRTPKYREIYDKEKEKQLKLLDEATTTKKTSRVLPKSKRKKEETIQDMNTTFNLSPPQSKGHADMRARRKAVKEFLKDLYIRWNSLDNNQEETIIEKQSNISLSPLVINEVKN